jgi:hypothetical protein
VGRVSPKSATQVPTRRVHVLALIGLAVSIALIQVHYFDWPPNRDVAAYATIGHELLNGRLLYSEVWDMKPPAIYLTYAAGEALLGYGPLLISVLNLSCALIVLVGLHRAGIASGLGPAAGLWSALFWTALTGDLTLQMQNANTEAFINASTVWAFVLLLPPNAPRPYARAVAAGALLGLASLYKPVVLPIALTLALAHLVFRASEEKGQRFDREEGATGRRSALLQICVIGAVGALLWAAVTAYFWLTGRLEIFHATMVTFNRAYSGSLWRNVAGALTLEPRFENSIPVRMTFALAFLAFVVLMSWLGLKRSRRWGLLLAYGIGAHLAVALPGKYYAHYFQLVLPVVAVGAGWGIVALARSAREYPAIRWAPGALAVVVLVGLVLRESVFWRQSAQELLPGSYAELYLASQEVGRRMNAALEPGEGMFQWGQEAGLYFASQRRPTSVVLCFSLVRGPLLERFTHRTLEDLESQPPELVIASRWFVDWAQNHPVFERIEERYRIVEPTFERTRRFFIVMVRRGGSLEARLSSSGAGPRVLEL